MQGEGYGAAEPEVPWIYEVVCERDTWRIRRHALGIAADETDRNVPSFVSCRQREANAEPRILASDSRVDVLGKPRVGVDASGAADTRPFGDVEAAILDADRRDLVFGADGVAESKLSAAAAADVRSADIVSGHVGLGDLDVEVGRLRSVGLADSDRLAEERNPVMLIADRAGESVGTGRCGLLDSRNQRGQSEPRRGSGSVDD